MRPASATPHTIHPTAVISERAQLADDVVVEAYAVIGDDVKIGKGCVIGAHSVVTGPTDIGEACRIGRHASIGADPQDMGFVGQATHLVIGRKNFFGDFTQVCRGTIKSHDHSTHIGDNNYLMAYTHVGHDCVLGNNIIIANYVGLGGHVVIEDNVYMGGQSVIHQFVRIGHFSMVSGGSASSMDIPPFVRVAGYGCAVHGLNSVGMKRSGAFSPDQLRAIKKLYSIFFREEALTRDALARLAREFPNDPNVAHFCDFVASSKRGVVRAHGSADAEA